jgi:hypothetical protein
MQVASLTRDDPRYPSLVLHLPGYDAPAAIALGAAPVAVEVGTVAGWAAEWL